MPILAGLHLLVAISLAVHAMRTGRHWAWIMVLMAMPLMGAVVYIAVELLPDLARSRRAREVTTNLRDVIDPDREFRNRVDAARTTDSADTKRALAEECERKGMFDDAIRLYREAAMGLFKDDPALLYPLARAQLGHSLPAEALATLDRLRAANPSWQSQEAHLLYARALEAQGKNDEALAEYDAVARYYAGPEAKVRFGLLLQKQGHPSRARPLFEEVVRAAGAGARAPLPSDREWLKVARANI